MQRSETSNSAENSSPNPRSETSDLLQTQNKTTELPDIQTEGKILLIIKFYLYFTWICLIEFSCYNILDTTDGIDSFTTSSDLSAEAEKINIYVRHAGKSKEYDIFPLEKISLLHQEACNYLNKNPEKMALVFEGSPITI